jgi:hypothetical protein
MPPMYTPQKKIIGIEKSPINNIFWKMINFSVVLPTFWPHYPSTKKTFIRRTNNIQNREIKKKTRL